MHATTQQHRVKAARHIAVGLLFVFMAIAPALAFADKTLGADGQNGTEDHPFTISNADELAYLADLVNNGATTVQLTGGNNAAIQAGFKDSYIRLDADIDLSGRDWTPIGNSSNRFRGCFDGNGHVVKGLKMEIQNQSGNNVYAGLFGRVLEGEIRNLGVRLAGEGIKVGSFRSAYVGGIAGWTYDTTIRNCYMDAEGGGKIIVNALGGSMGGIAGTLNGMMITHCYSTVDVDVKLNVPGNSNGFSGIGGIVGENSGTISHTYATGSVKGVGVTSGNGLCNLEVGGICGSNSGTIENNLALNKEVNGRIEGSGPNSVNRIVGRGTSNVTNNYASPRTTVVSDPPSSSTTDDENGADTWYDTFKDDLLKEPATNNGWGEGNGWKWPAATSTLLPKLDMVRPDGSHAFQPDIDARDYLDACPYPRLHIQSPAGITLTVTDAADPNNRPIADNKPVPMGTRLKLSHTITQDGYSLNHYLWGTDAGQIDQPVSGDTHDMPSHDLWISASVSYTKPTPVEPPYVPVYYTVTLPEVEGATTDPVAGSYEVEAWDTFRFYLMLDTAYDHSQPVVTTSRNEVLTPRKSDGAYLVKYVRSDVEIRIDSIRPNSPVGNEAIEAAGAPVIRAEGSIVFITVPRASEALLCDLSGRLVRTLSLPFGETRVEGLHPGIYLIKLPGHAGAKVIVGR